MKIKQKHENNRRGEMRIQDNIYSKNPRFKIQKILRSKIVQFNQKPLLLKSSQSISDNQKPECKITRPGTLSLKPNLRLNRYTEELQAVNRSTIKKTLRTQFDLKTIDVIKQEISKTLVKDLITLKTSQQETQLVTKNKNSLRLKLISTKNRSHTINYNQCCGLAEQRYERDLLLDRRREEVDVTPKLGVSQGKIKVVAPLIYFLKKKEITERCTGQPQQSLKKKKVNINSEESLLEQKSQFYSERKKKIKQMQQRREDLYSPWQITLNKYEANPQITQALFGLSKYNKSQKQM